MRACVQRVSEASVIVDGQSVGSIDHGLVVLLGVARGDEEKDARSLAEKIVNLRVFNDEDGKMNRSLAEQGGALLAISQFTLLGDCRKGRRPAFVEAAEPALAKTLYEQFIEDVRAMDVDVVTGVFQAMMRVALVNEGPVTILLDSRKLF